MYLIFYNKILNCLPKALENSGVIKSFIPDVIDFVERQIPVIEPCPESIKEFAEVKSICIGSPISIQISQFLKKNDIECEPSKISEYILTELLNTSSSDVKSVYNDYFSYSLGKGVYLNAYSSLDDISQGVSSIILDDTYQLYVEKNIAEMTTDKTSIQNAIQKRLSSVSDKNDFLECKSLSKLDDSQAFIILCQFLSDEDFDMNFLDSDVPVKDSPHFLYERIGNIIKGEYNFNLNPHSNLHRRYFSQKFLDDAIVSINLSLVKIRYLEIDSCIRKRPELLWKECYQIFILFNSLWNNSYYRQILSAGGRESTEIKQLFEKTYWVSGFWKRFSAAYLKLISMGQILDC